MTYPFEIFSSGPNPIYIISVKDKNYLLTWSNSGFPDGIAYYLADENEKMVCPPYKPSTKEVFDLKHAGLLQELARIAKESIEIDFSDTFKKISLAH